MIKKDQIKQEIRDFHTGPLPVIHKRMIAVPIDTHKIISLIGARRSGKTYIIYQIIQTLLQSGIDITDILFFSFETELLDYQPEELSLVLECYKELYPHKNDLKNCYFIFDEIQNMPRWESFLRRVYDKMCKNIFISGSNAKALSSEIATALRGRSITYNIWPLSFSEFLQFRELSNDISTSTGRASAQAAIRQYLTIGGMPELVLESRKDVQTKILQDYFQVMIFRDLVQRYNIKNTPALHFFIKRLLACAARSFSIHNIFNDLKSAGFKVSSNSLYKYLEYAQNVFLVYVVKQFARNARTRELGEKKVFAIDNGMLYKISIQHDISKAMEHAVLHQCLRQEAEIYYSKGKGECDFIISVHKYGFIPIQVCYSLETYETKNREIQGLIEAAKHVDTNQGIIITMDQLEETIHNGIRIKIIPLLEFLLQGVERIFE